MDTARRVIMLMGVASKDSTTYYRIHPSIKGNSSSPIKVFTFSKFDYTKESICEVEVFEGTPPCISCSACDTTEFDCLHIHGLKETGCLLGHRIAPREERFSLFMRITQTTGKKQDQHFYLITANAEDFIVKKLRPNWSVLETYDIIAQDDDCYTCSCAGFRMRHHDCKHLLALRALLLIAGRPIQEADHD